MLSSSRRRVHMQNPDHRKQNPGVNLVIHYSNICCGYSKCQMTDYTGVTNAHCDVACMVMSEMSASSSHFTPVEQEFPSIRYRAAAAHQGSTVQQPQTLIAQRIAVQVHDRAMEMQKGGTLPDCELHPLFPVYELLAHLIIRIHLMLASNQLCKNATQCHCYCP